MKILFHTNQLCYRGTEVSLFDYARYNEEILGNESIIVSDKNSNLEAYEKFSDRFKVYLYSTFAEVERLVDYENISHVYYAKAGAFDGKIVRNAENLIHAVFKTYQTHGEKFAFVSEWLSRNCSDNSIPFVPLIVEKHETAGDLRKSLNIPKDAMVLGYHGGNDSFNIGFAKQAVADSLEKRRDLYFIFMNISPFCSHERVFFLGGTYDLDKKSDFINTCDAMLHARDRGETFGLSIGEFSVKNKPVITCPLSPESHHIDVLKDKGIYYRSYNELTGILLNIRKSDIGNKNWDCYSELFNPAVVMKKFNDIFLSN